MEKNKTILKTLLLLIGGLGITLSGINWNIGITAWIGPVFLLMYTRNAKWYQMLFFFLVVAASGAISQTCNDLYHLTPVTIFNGLSFGILYSIVYVIDKLVYKKNDRFYYSLLFPSAIVLVEFAASSLIGTWGIIAHTQYEIKPLLQLSSLTGVFGISFIVAWFSSVVNWMIERKNECRAVYKAILIYGGVLFLVLLYGELRMTFHYPDSDTVKTAAVISETDILKFAEREKETLEKLAADYNTEVPSRLFSDSIAVATLINRTKEASSQGAKLIVWNEIALILSQDSKKETFIRNTIHLFE